MTGNTVRRRRVIIVGGGASGVLLAAHLLRGGGSGIEIDLIEREPEVGKGLAYSTDHPHHLLNVRAANMSAFGDDPDHLITWLAKAEPASGISDHSFFFIERRVYARYLASLIEPALGEPGDGRLRLVRSEAVACHPDADAIAVMLADGTLIRGDILVVATGHERRPEQWRTSPFASPWRTPAQSGVPRHSTVIIMGTGLTMVDYALALVSNGHTGSIHAISRNGRLPQVHRFVKAMHIARSEVPFGASLRVLVRWFRALLARARDAGCDWRACVDALRPHSWDLWRSLSLADKRRFQRRIRSIWDVHRHRMAPDVQGRIDWLVASGQLQIIAGRLLAASPEGDGRIRVVYRPRGARADASLHAECFVDCAGIHSDPTRSANPLIRDLVAKGLARGDPLNLGLEATPQWALVDKAGTPSTRFYAVGPLTRYAGWETIAIPDIRVQCAELANRIRNLEP